MKLLIFIGAGALIGWVTNLVAIRMIFRPYLRMRVMGMGVPFTPGLIHRRKDELADRVGDVVKQDLLKEERLREIAEGKLEDYLRGKNVNDSSLLGFCKSIGGNVTDKVLKQIRIDEIVSDEIRRIDTREIEKIVYRVVGRELKGIQYLGGLLGGIVGLAQYFLLTFM